MYWVYVPEEQVACYILSKSQHAANHNYQSADILRYRCISLVGSVSGVAHFFEWSTEELLRYSAQVDQFREMFWQPQLKRSTMLQKPSMIGVSEEALSGAAARVYREVRRLQQTAIASARDNLISTVKVLAVVSFICHLVFLWRFMRGMGWMGWFTPIYGAYHYYFRLSSRRELSDGMFGVWQWLVRSDAERQIKINKAVRKARLESRDHLFANMVGLESEELNDFVAAQALVASSLEAVEAIVEEWRNLEHKAKVLGVRDEMHSVLGVEGKVSVYDRIQAGKQLLAETQNKRRLEQERQQRIDELGILVQRAKRVSLYITDLDKQVEDLRGAIESRRRFLRLAHEFEQVIKYAEEEYERRFELGHR